MFQLSGRYCTTDYQNHHSCRFLLQSLGLYRNRREPTKNMVFVVDGRVLGFCICGYEDAAWDWRFRSSRQLAHGACRLP